MRGISGFYIFIQTSKSIKGMKRKIFSFYIARLCGNSFDAIKIISRIKKSSNKIQVYQMKRKFFHELNSPLIDLDLI